MADFSQNITNAVNVFGEGPSTKWGQAVALQTMTWGTSKWGEGSISTLFEVIKVISNTQSMSWNYYGADVQKQFEIGTMVATHDMGSEVLRDGSGTWTYVFPSVTTEGESRVFASWTSAASPDVTFTCQAAGSTSWSEV